MRSQPGAILSDRQYRLHQQLYQDGPLQYWSAHQLSQDTTPTRKLLQIPLPIYIRHFERLQQFKSQESYASLQTTPHVMSVEYTELHEDPNFLAFHPPPGQQLHQLLHSSYHQGSSMPWELAVYVAVQVCLGLHQGHLTSDQANERPFVLHGDLRPESLFLTENGKIQLLPFNQLHLWGDLREAWPNAVKRRYAYAAPERWQEDDSTLDPRIDLFGVGVLLYELLTGHLPHTGTTVEAIQKQVLSPSLPSLRSHISNLPSRLEATIYQLIHPSSHERPDSAGELAQLLVQLLDQEIGVEGYQQKLADFYRSLAQPFAANPTFENSMPTQVDGHLNQAKNSTSIRVPTPPRKSQGKPRSTFNMNDTAVTPSLSSEDLPTQTSKIKSANMSNKDPFSPMPGPVPPSQPSKSDTPNTQTSVPQPGALTREANTGSGPFTPASPFLAITPASKDIASMKEVGYSPSESTVVDSNLLEALRASMKDKKGEPALVPQVPSAAPRTSPPAPVRRDGNSASGFTGRFKRYEPPPPSSSEFSLTPEDEAPQTLTSEDEWANIRSKPPAAPTQLTASGSFAKPSPTPPSKIGTEFILEEDDDATSMGPPGSLVIPTSPPSLDNAPAPPSDFDNEATAMAPPSDFDDEATAMAPPGSLIIPPGPPSRAVATAAPPPMPPPRMPPPRIPPATPSGENEAGEDTGRHPTIQQSPLDVAPTMQATHDWAHSTSNDGNLPTVQGGAKSALDKAVFSFQADDDDDDDATMLQAPLSSGASAFSFATQQNYGVKPPHPSFTSKSSESLEGGYQISRKDLSAQAPHTLQGVNQTPPANSLFGATPAGIDPAQPLVPPSISFPQEPSGASTAPKPVDFSDLVPHKTASPPMRPKKSKGWLIPVLLILLLGGGSAASVLVLGWPPWKSLLSPSASELEAKRKAKAQKTRLALAKARTRDRSLDGIVLNPNARRAPAKRVGPPPKRRGDDDLPDPPKRRGDNDLPDPPKRRGNGNDLPDPPRLISKRGKPRIVLRKVRKRKVNRRKIVRKRRVRKRPIRRRVVRRKIARRKVKRRKPTRRRVVKRRKPERRRIKVAAIRGGGSGVQISIQPSCTVYKGRRRLGASYPPRSFKLPPGNHRLRCVNRRKKIVHHFSLLVASGQPTRYTRKLSPGKVLIRTRPWATIYIRGLGNVGKTGKMLTIYEGRYKVTLYKEGSKIPAPGNPKRMSLVVRPRKTSKPMLIVFPIIDDDL